MKVPLFFSNNKLDVYRILIGIRKNGSKISIGTGRLLR